MIKYKQKSAILFSEVKNTLFSIIASFTSEKNNFNYQTDFEDIKYA